MCGFSYVLSGVAFCQLLLNEYCIVLYYTSSIPDLITSLTSQWSPLNNASYLLT